MQKATRFLSVVTVFFVLPVLLISCGGGDTIVENVGAQQSTVVPLYSVNGANWNDYVADDGADPFSASDTACNPAVDTPCIHGGQMMSMAVPGKSSCTGLTAADGFQVFEWSCDDSVSPVRFVTTGFKVDRGLSDLIDFNAVSFRDNYLIVWEAGSVITASLPAVWWGNAVVVNNNAGSMNAGEINLVTQYPNTTPYTITADRVALLVRPGIVLTGSATVDETIITANGQNFIWVEGVIDATGDATGISLNVNFSRLNNLGVINADFAGIDLSGSNNSLSSITASGNNNYGVYLAQASNNSLSNITASGNSYGVTLFDSSNNNSLNNITASGNIYDGVFLDLSSSNILSNITASGNFHGVFIDLSSNNSLSNITASGNSNNGVYLRSSSDISLSNITASGNGWIGVIVSLDTNNNSLSNITASGNGIYGIGLVATSTNNTFTGELQVGDNATSNCYVEGGTNPGLVDITCTDTGIDGSNTYGTNSSDALLTTNVSVASSFVDPAVGDYSLLTTDNVIRDVLAIPTGIDSYTRTWSDASTTEMLRNAVEIQNDGIGNDNLLCESNETCLYTPNIAAYQGHGDLVSAGTFSDGTITGVTLLRYGVNGY